MPEIGEMKNVLTNSVILLTGGTGSFGRSFCKEALKYNPKTIRIYSRGEHLQIEMEQQFNRSDVLSFLIGDVRDHDRLKRAMTGVDIIIHAAALKCIPKIEYNVLEGMKTNVMGSANVVNAAIDSGVSKIMLISTDKVAHANTAYGMQKALAERIFIQGNVYGESRFSAVRYGNVVASRGSILPLFQGQRKDGYVTITDSRMTRFFLSLKQGVAFVLSSLAMMMGGEIFVPKIPSMRVVDFAKAVCPECTQRIIGIRPSEKLHEILVTEDEARHTIELEDRYIIKPEWNYWNKSDAITDFMLPDGFSYTSKNNPHQLTKDELLEMINAC